MPADAVRAGDPKTEADRGKYPFPQHLDPFINRTVSHRTAKSRRSSTGMAASGIVDELTSVMPVI